MDAKQTELILSWRRRAARAWKQEDGYTAFISLWIAFNAFCYARYVGEAVRKRADLNKCPDTIAPSTSTDIEGNMLVSEDAVRINITLPQRIAIVIKERYSEDRVFAAFSRNYEVFHEAQLVNSAEYVYIVEHLRTELSDLWRYQFKGKPYITNMARVAELRSQETLESAEARGIVIIFSDNKFQTLLKLLYQIRCNIFHGEKTLGEFNDDKIVCAAFPVLSSIMDTVVCEKALMGDSIKGRRRGDPSRLLIKRNITEPVK